MPVASPDAPSDRPLLDKLGVKPGARVAAIDIDDAFLGELRTRTEDVATGRPEQDSDLIFVFVSHRDHLDDRIGPLRSRLDPDGAIWVIRPKGSKDIKEVDIIEAGKRLGLVDNKIASFSETLSAMRLVIPVALRPNRGAARRRSHR